VLIVELEVGDLAALKRIMIVGKGIFLSKFPESNTMR